MAKGNWQQTLPSTGKPILALRDNEWMVVTARNINHRIYYEYIGKLYPWQGFTKWAYIETLEECK